MQALIPLLLLVFLLYCVLDVVRSGDEEVRNLPRLIWLALVILVPVVGGVAWLVAGRPEPSDRGGTARGGGSAAGGARGPHRPRPPAPRGPDDDPEFLARLERRLRGGDDAPGA